MMEYLRFVLLLGVALILFMSNSDGMLARLGFEQSVLLSVFAALLLTSLIYEYRLVFVIATLLLAVGANLPAETALGLGFERDYAIAALLAALISPWVVRMLDS